MALGAAVEQKILVPLGAGLDALSAIAPLDGFRIADKGRVDTIANRIRIFMLVQSFCPHVVMKWGSMAGALPVGDSRLQISFFEKGMDVRRIKRSDFVMALSPASLEVAKAGGFSGVKSFIFPPFVYDLKTPVPARSKLFIPERGTAVFIGSRFGRDVRLDPLFEVLSQIPEIYFLICGQGPDEEFVASRARSWGIKPRARFVVGAEK